MLVDRRRRIAEAWNKVYEDIDSIPFLPWVNTILPAYQLKQLVGKIANQDYIRILDYGCGTGRLGKFIADKYSNCDVFYYDASIMALDYCIKHENIDINRVIFPYKEPEELFNENEFDGVISWGVFHHTDPDDWKEYRDHICSILKPGGVLLFGDFTHEDVLFKEGKRISEITKIESYPVCVNELFSEVLCIEEEGIFPFVENTLNRHRIINYIFARKIC